MPDEVADADGWSPYPCEEELALGAELAALDLAEWAADLDAPVEAGWVRDGDDDGPGLLDVDVLDALDGPATAADLLAIDSLDLAALTDPVDRLRVVRALDRVIAHATALQHEVVVGVVGAEVSGRHLEERHREVELAAARRTSHYSAGVAIERARALHSTFPGYLRALRAGEVSPAHTAVLVEQTRAVESPEVLDAIEARTLPRAPRQTPGQLKAAVVAAVAELDPDASARHRRAREQRRVGVRRLEDGLGFLGLVHDWSTVAAIERVVRSDGRRLAAARGGASAVAAGDDDAGADACRADALAARILGEVRPDGSVRWDREPARIEVQVVLDLATLRSEADHVCLLDGAPVPAAIGREVADAAAWWRRVVTAPVTGHLLDYGSATYLPSALRRHVLARDGGCRSPFCTAVAPDRMQLDHVLPFPDGPSDTANTGALCASCHQLKTDGLLDLDSSAADGSVTWRTAWGQSIHVPPRAFLRDPDPPDPAGPPPQGDEVADPPPF